MLDWRHYDINQDEDFANEEKEYIVMAKGTAFPRSYNRGDFVNANQLMFAYVDKNANQLIKSSSGMLLMWNIDNDKDDTYKTRFSDGGIYLIKARKWLGIGPNAEEYPKNLEGLYVTEVLEKLDHFQGLDEIYEQYLKPVTINNSVLGQLNLNKEIDAFEGTILYHEREIGVSIAVNIDREKTWKKNIDLMSEVYKNLEDYDLQAKKLISTKLYRLACQYNEEENCHIDQETISERIKLSGISIESGNVLSLDYEDDNIFGGHCIVAEGKVKTGIKKAYICG